MRLDPHPSFRKIIVPWYDTLPFCIAVVVFMITVLGFSLVGILAGLENTAYHRYTWVPILLSALSILVITCTAFRMLRRYLIRLSK